MTAYYARGSAFSKNILKNFSNHFAREYQDSEPESQALAYISHILLSDEKLFGPHGIWVDRNIHSKWGEHLSL